MSDRCQHRLEIYHFTLNREFLSSHLYSCCQKPSAIGAASTEFANEDFAICVWKYVYPTYIRSDNNNFLYFVRANAIFVPFILGSLENSKYQHIPLAASVGFEPTGGSSPPPVFKTGAINRTLPTRHIAGLSRLSTEVKLNEKWYW